MDQKPKARALTLELIIHFKRSRIRLDLAKLLLWLIPIAKIAFKLWLHS